jgi:signal transduction histidine kinase
VTVSPDGKWLVTGSGHEYEFWDTNDWQSKRKIPRDTPDVLNGPAAFTPDGKILALAQTQRLIKLLDGKTGEELAALQSPDPQFINRIVFNREGTLLAAATSGPGVQVWDLTELHRELAALGLDWQTTPAPPQVFSSGVPAQSRLLISIILGGVLLAVSSAFFVLRRHRGLVEAYQQTELQMIGRTRELELAKAEIMHTQKMKALGTLAAGIAHDFNNLLSVIRMSNKLIGRADVSQETQENVAEIERAVQQGKRVVGSMLGYSREPETCSGPFSVAEMVEDMVAMLNKQFLSGITLTLELAPDARPVGVSRGRLEQALLNLVVNAAEAMNGIGSLRLALRNITQLPESGVVVLKPRAAEHYLEVTISDSGPGISPEILSEIFEPFFTTKTTGAAHGTGLGLSLVYSIAEQHGFGLNVETKVGQGTTFCLVIPAV